jgi:hypothetical protein
MNSLAALPENRAPSCRGCCMVNYQTCFGRRKSRGRLRTVSIDLRCQSVYLRDRTYGLSCRSPVVPRLDHEGCGVRMVKPRRTSPGYLHCWSWSTPRECQTRALLRILVHLWIQNLDRWHSLSSMSTDGSTGRCESCFGFPRCYYR